MQSLKTCLLTAAAALTLVTGIARADIIFLLGNNPQADEENVLFNGAGTINTGFTVTGRTNQSDVLVAFTSNELLETPPAGQARVDAVDGSWNYLLINLFEGGTFGDLIFNLKAVHDNSGIAQVTVHQLVGPDAIFNLNVGNGENFLTILAVNGQRMTSVEIDANTGVTALEVDDGRQFRISEVDGTTNVPEPLSLALLGIGMIGLYGARRRSSQS